MFDLSVEKDTLEDYIIAYQRTLVMDKTLYACLELIIERQILRKWGPGSNEVLNRYGLMKSNAIDVLKRNLLKFSFENLAASRQFHSWITCVINHSFVRTIKDVNNNRI